MYNAHLDVIHSFIAEAAPSDGPTSKNNVDEAPVKYTTIGASKDKIVLRQSGGDGAAKTGERAHSICVCV